MRPKNYFLQDRTMFVINILLEIGNSSPARDHVSLQKRVECTLKFQFLSLQDQNLKSINNPIL